VAHNKNAHKDKNDKDSASVSPAAQPAPEENLVTIAKEEYEALKAKAEERDAFSDKYVRAHAEFENIRKRLEKEKADFIKYANESLIFDLLPIIDNLEIAEKHIKEAKDFKAVQDGVDMIQLQIQGFLKDIGLERMKTIGEKFDPHMHEPIETVEAHDREEGTITDELKPGYKLNGKLMRPASVKIVKNST